MKCNTDCKNGHLTNLCRICKKDISKEGYWHICAECVEKQPIIERDIDADMSIEIEHLAHGKGY